jgi:hypothetical protein
MRVLRVPSILFFVASVSALAVACGSRGPLDIGDESQIGGNPAIATDASGFVDVGANDDGSNPTPVDSGRNPRGNDAGNTFDSGIPAVNCAACVFQSCGQDVIGCVTSTGCRTTLQCVATTCLTGGTPSPTCLFTCGQSDPQSVPQVLTLVECVLSSCGQDCTSVLTGGGIPGLGGDGGFGGGGGGGRGRDGG